MSILRRFSLSDPGLPNRPSRRHRAMDDTSKSDGGEGDSRIRYQSSNSKNSRYSSEAYRSRSMVSVSILSWISLGPQDRHRFDSGLRLQKHEFVKRACLLDFAAGDMSVGLCPNEETVDQSRSFLMHGGADGDKSFKSHPIITAHLNHVHRDPVLMDPPDFR